MVLSVVDCLDGDNNGFTECFVSFGVAVEDQVAVEGGFGGVGGVGPGEVQHGVVEGVGAHGEGPLVHRVHGEGSFDAMGLLMFFIGETGSARKNTSILVTFLSSLVSVSMFYHNYLNVCPSRDVI